MVRVFRAPQKPRPPDSWTRRGRRCWTLQLPVAAGAVTAALAAVANGEVKVVGRQPSRIDLTCGDSDRVLHVAVELRTREHGIELAAIDEGRSVSQDSVKAGLLAAFVLCMGLGMPDELPIRSLMYAASLPSLMFVVASWIDSKSRREGDFRRVVQAVDRAVAPLRTHDERPYRALARDGASHRSSVSNRLRGPRRAGRGMGGRERPQPGLQGEKICGARSGALPRRE